jgi:7-cyano-7-deazaguanine synthase
MSEKKAIVLLSGGLDSAVTLAHAVEQGYSCYALSFDYGQRHKIELLRAKKVAVTLRAQEHKIISVDLRSFGGSALTADIPVPAAREQIGEEEQIPATYVPARNTVFLSLALSWAEVVRAEVIFIGANSVDYSGYPDCRPEYLEAYEKMAQLATKSGTSEQWKLKIAAPLLRMTKADIVKRGKELGVDFALTSSCYNPQQDGIPCRNCEACLLRAKGFAEAGMVDPTIVGSL